MSGRSGIADSASFSAPDTYAPGVRERLLLRLFVASFFLPYFPDTRLRVDVVMSYAFMALFLFIGRVKSPFERRAFFVAALGFFWCFFRILLSTVYIDNYFFALTLLTNLNFAFFAFCIWFSLSNLLARSRDFVLTLVLAVAILINMIAVFQWLSPDHPINSMIFDNYGGVLSESTKALGQDVLVGITTNAEFLAKYAGRYSSIFNGMHALALFNVLIISIAVPILALMYPARRLKQWATFAIGAAVVGGVLSASKTFYFGTAIALAVLAAVSVLGPRRFILTALVVGLPALLVLTLGTSGGSTIDSVFHVFITGDMGVLLDSRYGGEGLNETIYKVLGSGYILLLGVGIDIGDLYLADNAFLQPLIIGGLPLTVCFFAVVALFLRENYRQYRRGNKLAAGFLAAHTSFLMAGIGIPSYQLGRITLLLFVLNLMVLRPFAGKPLKNKARLKNRVQQSL